MDKTIIHSRNPLEYTIGGYSGEEGTWIQLAGNRPEELHKAVKIVLDHGYRKINLNCGCPSERANDHHGVYLMKDPSRTRSLCDAMVEASKDYENVRLSVKCRNGVDTLDSYDDLNSFIDLTSKSGISEYIIHARKAILGFCASKNLSVPKINYEYTYCLMKDFPHLNFTINGEIKSLEDIEFQIQNGVIIFFLVLWRKQVS